MKKTALIFSAIMAFSCVSNPPKTAMDGTVDVYFGHEVKDPYRWLEDDNSPETAAWVEAQNKYTDSYLKKIPGRKALLKRLTELANYEKTGMPTRRANGKWYFYRNNGLQNQSVLYEAPDLESASSAPSWDSEPEVPTKPDLSKARVFLDPNTLSEDGTVALKGVYFNKDASLAAYTISRSGSDWQEFYVMDVKTGALLEDHIQWAKFSGAAWHGDGFYYSAYGIPEEGHEFSVKNEGHKVFYHKIGTPQSADKVFFENPAEPLRFYVLETNDTETLAFLVEDGADTGNNLYVKDLRKKDSPFVQITTDMKNNCYPIEDDGETIYLFTNREAPNNRLVKTTLKNPRKWTDVIPEGESVLDGVLFAGDKIIATYMKDACTKAYLIELDGDNYGQIPLPGVGTASFNARKGEPWCFMSFTSFTVPGAVYALDLKSQEYSIFTRPATAFDQSLYTTEQVFYPSKDGTKIPMFLTYRKDLQKNGKNPVYLYGYGGFNISLTPGFSASRIPFLEKGGIYAQASLRGGGEYGESWHLAGTKMNKQNVFDDFIAAAEWLIANDYTCPEKLAIVGGSNGGLLVGACMTQRPELFAVAVPQVGVMDMLRYHKFTIGWNWAPDYGTSEDSERMFRYLRSYSPLHNLKPGTAYPATLVTTADHDDRVVPAHSFKFAATLQNCNVSKKPQLIRIDSKAGHGGGKPLAKVLEEQADIYSFIMYNLGM